MTDEEAARLRRLHTAWTEPISPLVLSPDPAHEGWQTMQGPCIFRRLDRPLAAGGCRIYDDRPAGCDIFTCAFLLSLRQR